MKLAKITEWIDNVLDVKSFSDVSNNGVQIARTGEEVKKVAFGVDASVAFIEAAVAAGAVVSAAIRHNVALYGVHLPLDANHAYGNNYELARYLGLKNLKPAFVYHGETIGCTGTLPNGKKVGVCSGGAGEFAVDAKKIGCDLYVTGEASWGDVIAAENVGMRMICAGHYATETFGVKALAKAMKKALRVDTVFIPRAEP